MSIKDIRVREKRFVGGREGVVSKIEVVTVKKEAVLMGVFIEAHACR